MIVRYGSKNIFPNMESRTTRIPIFKDKLIAFFEKNNIMQFDTKEAIFNTEGLMDIDYYALIMADKKGGFACVFHTVNWGVEYESMRPRVQLYGGWKQSESALSDFLNTAYPS